MASSPSTEFAYLVLDLETTGLERTSEILQLCCMSIDNTDDLLSMYMLPTAEIKPSASKVTGCPVLIAHNGYSFDFPILYNSLKAQGLLSQFLQINVKLLDSLTLLKRHASQKNSLIHQCKSKSISALHQRSSAPMMLQKM
ncbi:uncharacterized protein LOC110246720 [Exaiptasia diaphana]|uniref:YprB ribonuclease H-like domain-containing protein n=1 Tax=Exaiptasia diaphana TaxID=2652724 RepID=A0A913YRQ3_EXADI|nr:uncharacterized protein LOC110246720 [Exaiptasia diaphana]